jgi:hypothetical protein
LSLGGPPTVATIDAEAEDFLENVLTSQSQWMHSTWRMARSDEVHVNAGEISDETFRIVVSERGLSFNIVTIDLRRFAGTVRATARMDWHADFGLEHDGSYEPTGGHVWIDWRGEHLADWQPGRLPRSWSDIVAIQFELHGTWDESQVPWCIHGAVVIPR